MKREIKFRGMTPYGTWEYGSLIIAGNARFIVPDYVRREEDISVEYQLVIPNSVGQYSGEKGKYDTEIYEGDLVKVHQFLFDGTEIEREHKAEIVYQSAAFCFRFYSGDWVKEYTGEDNHISPIDFVCGLHEESFEVIGNIHENPELLEKEAV